MLFFDFDNETLEVPKYKIRKLYKQRGSNNDGVGGEKIN